METEATAQSSAVALLASTASLDQSCMVLAFRSPATVLLRQIEELGGDAEHVFILDAVDQNPLAARRYNNVMGGFNPGMLERLLLRAGQIIRRERERDLVLIVDGFDEILQANAPAAVMELVMRMKEDPNLEGAHLDFLHRPGLAPELLGPLSKAADSFVRIGP